MPETARHLACTILNSLDSDAYLTLDQALTVNDPALSQLSRKDRAFLNALVFGVLRWRNRLDHIIGALSKTPLKKVDKPVLTILRLAVFQLQFMDRVPPSAAVNTAVDLVKQNGSPSFIANYVNGLLRNVIRKSDQIPLPDVGVDPVMALSFEQSFPFWMIKRWINRFGPDATQTLCQALNVIPGITLRVNTLKISRKDLQDLLAANKIETEATDCSPYGLKLTHHYDRVDSLPGFNEGFFQVQDEAAQLVSLLLAPQPGDRVLDACAGLGGKTGHMAQMMSDSGGIWAVDVDRNKLEKLAREMERIHVHIVQPVRGDFTRPFTLADDELFDRVLVDAPCSGLGVIRRNPDIKWRTVKKNLSRYHKRQCMLLANASASVKPNGTLVYAVCSTEPEETDQVVRAFLSSHDDFSIGSHVPPALSPLLSDEGYLRLLPHQVDMDGFFAVKFFRNG